MADPFSFLSKGGSTPSGHVRHVTNQRREAVISAYRHNIALPELHIADRDKPFVPVIVGEDGQEMSPERRAEMMKNKTPMIDENRRVRGIDPEAELVDYTEQFEGDIERERWGKSAEENRPGMRIVRPKQLRIQLEVEALEGLEDTYVPEVDGVPCVYTTTFVGIRDIRGLREHVFRGKAALLRNDVSTGLAVVYASEDVLDIIDEMLDHTFNWRDSMRAYGAPIHVDSSLRNELRLASDPAIQPQMYASIFIAKDLYEEYVQGVETTVILKEMDHAD